MQVVIYGIGGSFNEQLAGTAHDPVTALNLLHLIGFLGGTGCSLHGPIYSAPCQPLSGEMSLEAADQLFRRVRDEQAAKRQAEEQLPY